MPNLLDRHNLMVLVTGLSMGVLGVLLVLWGNPQNSGICVSCFIENSAGALGLHDNPRMQYLRPELVGFVLGAVGAAFIGREFHSRGGGAPLSRLFAGFFLIVGCAVFIGCPIKLFLRFVAGDMTTLIAIFGLVVGVWLGLKGLAAGVHFGGSRRASDGSGLWIPLTFVLLLFFVLWPPGFLLLSTRGGAAQAAPALISLAAGLALGGLAQRSRFCVTASIRDSLLMGRRSPLLWGFLVFLLSGFTTSLLSGQFNPGFYGQPGAHTDLLWGFLGMMLVGLISVLIGGCPFRQLIKSGEGDADAGLVVVGMFLGGGLVQSWQIAATTAGVGLYGKVSVMAGFVFILVNMLLYRDRSET